jgi:hypothetical protein
MDFELLDQNENVHRNLNRPYPSVSKAIRVQLDFGLSESTPTWSDEFELEIIKYLTCIHQVELYIVY